MEIMTQGKGPVPGAMATNVDLDAEDYLDFLDDTENLSVPKNPIDLELLRKQQEEEKERQRLAEIAAHKEKMDALAKVNAVSESQNMPRNKLTDSRRGSIDKEEDKTTDGGGASATASIENASDR